MQINCKNHSSCGFAYTHSVISGKYKMVLLYILGVQGTVRYNQIKRMIEGISHKALTNSLRELETDGLISRIEYPQIPPKVEYSLTAKGADIMPMLEALCQWGNKYKDSNKDADGGADDAGAGDDGAGDDKSTKDDDE